MTETFPPRGTVENRTLCSYLEGHLAGATAGVRLFEAARSSWAGSRHEEVLAALAAEISAERQELLDVLHALGYRRSTVKLVLAHLAAQVSRINPINLRRSGTTSGAQLELETLQSAVRGKECLWESLLVLQQHAPDGVPLSTGRLQTLLRRAREQQQEVAHIMRETTAERFLDGAS
jgi:hypothetical protein